MDERPWYLENIGHAVNIMDGAQGILGPFAGQQQRAREEISQHFIETARSSSVCLIEDRRGARVGQHMESLVEKDEALHSRGLVRAQVNDPAVLKLP